MHKRLGTLLLLSILLSTSFHMPLHAEPTAEDMELMAAYEQLLPEQKAEVDRRIQEHRQKILQSQKNLAKDRVALQKERVFLRRDLAIADKDLKAAQDDPTKARLQEKRNALQSQMAAIDEQRLLKQSTQMEMMQEFDEIVRQAIEEFKQEENN